MARRNQWIRIQVARIFGDTKSQGRIPTFSPQDSWRLKLSRCKGRWARFGIDKLNLNFNLESLQARDWICRHSVEVLLHVFFQIFWWNHPPKDLSESGRSGNPCHSSERSQVRSNVYVWIMTMSSDLSKKVKKSYTDFAFFVVLQLGEIWWDMKISSEFSQESRISRSFCFRFVFFFPFTSCSRSSHVYFLHLRSHDFYGVGLRQLQRWRSQHGLWIIHLLRLRWMSRAVRWLVGWLVVKVVDKQPFYPLIPCCYCSDMGTIWADIQLYIGHTIYIYILLLYN